MATRLYKYSPDQNETEITDGVGSAVASDAVEVTIELANTVYSEGSQRVISKEEVILGLEKIINYINAKPWPPA